MKEIGKYLQLGPGWCLTEDAANLPIGIGSTQTKIVIETRHSKRSAKLEAASFSRCVVI
jgi:hypothetical protein